MCVLQQVLPTNKSYAFWVAFIIMVIVIVSIMKFFSLCNYKYIVVQLQRKSYCIQPPSIITIISEKNEILENVHNCFIMDYVLEKYVIKSKKRAMKVRIGIYCYGEDNKII